jgi:hypothetical protein
MQEVTCHPKVMKLMGYKFGNKSIWGAQPGHMIGECPIRVLADPSCLSNKLGTIGVVK